MFTKEQIAFLDKLADEERLCNVCYMLHHGCNGGVHGGPNGPIFPKCTESDYEVFVDIDALEEEMNMEEDT